MKKFTLILILMSLSIGLFAQSTPVSDLRVATAATEFKINLPIGTKVYNIEDGKYWVATIGVDGSKSLTSASGSFKQLNADGSSFVTIDQTIGQTIGTTTNRLTQLWANNIDATNITASNLTVTSIIGGSISGNANTVTTNANLDGPVTSVGNLTTIIDKAVTLPMMADFKAGSLMGNSALTNGTPEAISVGAGLTLIDGKLTASGLGGTVKTVSVTTLNGVSGTVANPTTTPAITLTLGDITPTSVAATGTVSGTQLISNIPIGTAPLIVTSTTPVANLNIEGTAGNVTGVVKVVNGGTGLATLTDKSYMMGAGIANVAFKTAAEVLIDIKAAPIESASLFQVDSFEEGTTGANGQDHILTKPLKAGCSVQVILNGSPLKATQYAYSLTTNTVKILIPVYQYDAVTISYGY